MAKKVLNERCPLQTECERKTCEYVRKELECPYYSANSRDGYYWNSYTMKHEANEKLDRIYALLMKMGYEMSDDEKSLQDGTHELFRTDCIEKDPCEICKAAHPHCDKCCKTCDTPCNSEQECRRGSEIDE